MHYHVHRNAVPLVQAAMKAPKPEAFVLGGWTTFRHLRVVLVVLLSFLPQAKSSDLNPPCNANPTNY